MSYSGHSLHAIASLESRLAPKLSPLLHVVYYVYDILVRLQLMRMSLLHGSSSLYHLLTYGLDVSALNLKGCKFLHPLKHLHIQVSLPLLILLSNEMILHLTLLLSNPQSFLSLGSNQIFHSSLMLLLALDGAVQNLGASRDIIDLKGYYDPLPMLLLMILGVVVDRAHALLMLERGQGCQGMQIRRIIDKVFATTRVVEIGFRICEEP